MKHFNWRKGLKIVLKRSVVTGVPELVEARNVSRFLRLCVLIFCLCGFLYYTTAFLMKYWQYPTVMDVVVDYPEEIELPAVTICDYNAIQSTLFCSMYPESCSPYKNYSEFCKEYFYFCDRNYKYDNNISVPAVSPYELPKLSRAEYRYMGVESDDLIEECQLIHPSYGSDRCGHSVMWIPVFDSMGLPNNCYAINSFIGNLSIKPYTTLSKAYVIIKLRTETSDTFYTSTPSAIQMSVHNSRDYLNPFKKGISLKPCFNYNMFISKTINELLPYPYATNCTDYLELWKARGGFGPLSKTQCREECLLNVSLKEAGCVDPIYIYYPNEAKMCDHPAMSNFYYKQCADSCNRACNRENIRVAVEEYASLLSLRDKDGVEQCSSVITLAFNRMELKKFSYYPKYERVDLFGIIGGYLGVWLGISLLAVTDLLETLFVIIKVIKEAIQKTKKKSNWLSKDDYLQNRYHADSRGNFRLKIY